MFETCHTDISKSYLFEEKDEDIISLKMTVIKQNRVTLINKWKISSLEILWCPFNTVHIWEDQKEGDYITKYLLIKMRKKVD